MHPPLILIPPSEGKAPAGAGPKWAAGTMAVPALDPGRRAVLAALAKAMGDPEVDNAKLLGVKGDALAAAVKTNKAARRSPTRPAIERYTGVLYDALDAASLTATDRKRLGAQVLIFSGLFGLVAPGDPIPDHKLKMSVSLPGIGKVATYWRPRIDRALAPLCADRTVWDLLPNEHAVAWSGPPASATVVTVRFLDDVERKGGRELVAVSHWNKLLKGALVRHVLATQLTDPSGLADFSHPQGYLYEPSLTAVDGNRIAVSLVARR